MKLYLWIVALFIYTSHIHSQENTIALVKVADNIKCGDQKEKPIIVTKKAELDALLLPSSINEAILKNVDFNTENLVFICFLYGGPGICGKAYFEYFLINNKQQQSLKVRIHDALNDKALYFNSVALKISKNYPLANLSLNKEYVKYKIKSAADMDSICNRLDKQFKP